MTEPRTLHIVAVEQPTAAQAELGAQFRLRLSDGSYLGGVASLDVVPVSPNDVPLARLTVTLPRQALEDLPPGAARFTV